MVFHIEHIEKNQYAIHFSKIWFLEKHERESFPNTTINNCTLVFRYVKHSSYEPGCLTLPIEYNGEKSITIVRKAEEEIKEWNKLFEIINSYFEKLFSAKPTWRWIEMIKPRIHSQIWKDIGLWVFNNDELIKFIEWSKQDEIYYQDNVCEALWSEYRHYPTASCLSLAEIVMKYYEQIDLFHFSITDLGNISLNVSSGKLSLQCDINNEAQFMTQFLLKDDPLFKPHGDSPKEILYLLDCWYELNKELKKSFTVTHNPNVTFSFQFERQDKLLQIRFQFKFISPVWISILAQHKHIRYLEETNMFILLGMVSLPCNGDPIYCSANWANSIYLVLREAIAMETTIPLIQLSKYKNDKYRVESILREFKKYLVEHNCLDAGYRFVITFEQFKLIESHQKEFRKIYKEPLICL